MDFNGTRLTTNASNNSTSAMTSPGVLPLRVMGNVKDSRKAMSATTPASPGDQSLARTLYIVGPGSIIIGLFVISIVTMKLKAKKRTEERSTQAAPVRSVAINVDLADPPPCYVDVMKNLAIYKKPPRNDPFLPTYAEATTVLASQQDQGRNANAKMEIISPAGFQLSTNQEEGHNT